MVGRLVRRPEDHEELCQDVFVRVYEKLGEFSFQSKLSTWIATIAYRHALNHLRKRRLLTLDLPAEEDSGAVFRHDDDPESILAARDMDAFVLKLVDELPVHYRTVLLLYHVEGMHYPEIGEITGMPEGTVKNYLFRARNLLKEKVKPYLDKDAT